MNPALWAAKTGLDAQQTRMTVTSNNLANVNTSGFKKGRAVFEDLLYQNVKQVGAATSQDTQAPSGVSPGSMIPPGISSVTLCDPCRHWRTITTSPRGVSATTLTQSAAVMP